MYAYFFFIFGSMKKEETVDYAVKTLWHGIYRMYNQRASQHGFTTSIGYVLLYINPKEGTQATKIAPSIGLESRSLTRMLKSMEEKGLITRKPDEHDKRSVRIHLTEFGREKRELSRETVLLFNHAIREKIPQDKLDVFFEVVSQINNLIEEDVIEKKPILK
jgi:MarR family transcriptional regulator, organic hydroperoxide resistance regulator